VIFVRPAMHTNVDHGTRRKHGSEMWDVAWSIRIEDEPVISITELKLIFFRALGGWVFSVTSGVDLFSVELP
jgi:hypothetical protein